MVILALITIKRVYSSFFYHRNRTIFFAHTSSIKLSNIEKRKISMNPSWHRKAIVHILNLAYCANYICLPNSLISHCSWFIFSLLTKCFYSEVKLLKICIDLSSNYGRSLVNLILCITLNIPGAYLVQKGFLMSIIKRYKHNADWGAHVLNQVINSLIATCIHYHPLLSPKETGYLRKQEICTS